MAEVPYSGVADVAPDTRLPDDYQHIQANPAAFGGLIGQGLQTAGEGISKGAEFFGQIAADDANNQFQDFATKLLHGDANKQVPGPDGQMQPDTGYLGLKGRSALDARPGVEQQLDAELKRIRSGLQTPQQQLQFDSFSRRYRSLVSEKIGSHADGQATVYGQGVADAAINLAKQHIANNATDPTEVAHGASDLINAYVKRAQLQGAQPGDEIYNNAVRQGKQEALSAQITAVSANDPAKALSILDKNRDIAGDQYTSLRAGLVAKADRDTGIKFGQQALDNAQTQPAAGPNGKLPESTRPPGAMDQIIGGDGKWVWTDKSGKTLEPVQPSNKPANAPAGGVADPAAMLRHFEDFRARPYWDVNHWRVGYGSDTVTHADGTIEPVTAMTTVTREDAERDLRRRTAQSASQAQTAIGPAWSQLPDNAKASIVSIAYNYGRVPQSVAVAAQTGDPQKIAQAIAGLSADNNGVNAKRRQAEAANVVGKFGLSGPEAAATGTNYTLPAAAANAGAPGNSVATPETPSTAAPIAPEMPQVSQAPAPPSPIETPKANAYAQVDQAEQSGQLTHEAAQHARQYITQELQAKEIAAAEDEKARRRANDQAVNEYITAVGTGQKIDLNKLYNDARLTGETKLTLPAALQRAAGRTAESDAKDYGPGFWEAYKNVTAPVGDPNRMTDPAQILRRAGPDGDLTLEGAQKLLSTLNSVQKSVNDQSVHTAKTGLMNYAKGNLSFEQDLGPIKIRDPKGEAIFNSQFIPKFEAAYDQWVKDGKNPWDFLQKENVDKMIAGLRPKAQMDAERIKALNSATGEAPDVKNAPLPPAPEGVDENGWKSVVATPPPMPNGSPRTHQNWAAVLETLKANPTPKVMEMFDRHYGQFGLKAKDVLDKFNNPQQPPAASGGHWIFP